MDELEAAIRSKEMELKHERKNGNGAGSNNEALNVRGRSDKRDGSKVRGKSRSKSTKLDKTDKSKFRCHHCKELGHFKREYLERMKKFKERKSDSGNASIASESFESAEVLIHSIAETQKEWILDSGCSFHMSPNKEWYLDLEKIESGTVLLGNNKAYKILGIGSVKIRMFDGHDRILKNVRYVPKLR